MTVFDDFSLADHHAIVTGGASGLGLGMATALAEAGSTVTIFDINEAGGQAAAASIAEQTGRLVEFRRCDVTDEESVVTAVADTAARFGRIDVLVNNAGITIHTPLESTTLRDWRKVMDINLDGMFLVLREVGAVMLKQRSGSIINTASMSGLIANVPQPQASYNSSKGAVILLTQSAAVEWADRGVRVNAIAPGYMKTELTKPYFEAGGPQIDQWMSMTPMGRPGEPREVASAAVFLASKASSYMTGSVVRIDGGYTAA